MFKVFAFGFEARNKTILPLIYRLINEDLLVADHISIRCQFSSWTYLASDKHVLAFRFQSVSPGAWCTGVHGFHAARVESEWYMTTITVMSCCSNSCCQTSAKLLVTFTFQCTTRAPEHQPTVTKDFRPHTIHAASQQTRPQFCRLYGILYRKTVHSLSKVV